MEFDKSLSPVVLRPKPGPMLGVSMIKRWWRISSADSGIGCDEPSSVSSAGTMATVDDRLLPATENLSVRSTPDSCSSGVSYSFSGSFSSQKGCRDPGNLMDRLVEKQLISKDNTAIDLHCYSVSEDYASIDKFPQLVILEHVPWIDQDVLDVLQNGLARDFCASITLELLQKVSFILQRPLVRIAQEAQRLSSTFCKCTKYEIQSAARIVLPRTVADRCINGCLKAGALYTMGGDSFKQSKSFRCGLHLSVGLFHRWMVDTQVSLRIHEIAAVYLAAIMETLVEELLMSTVGRTYSGEPMITTDMFDLALANNPELWGLVQPYQHLVCCRDAHGVLSLPLSLDLTQITDESTSKGKGRKQERVNGSLLRNLEQSLLATCVGSMSELGDLVSRTMHHWYNKSSQGNNKTDNITWGPAAQHALFHYMKCSQLEHVENLDVNPPSVLLEHERPYTSLPPLIEWIRVATAHTEYRHGWMVDGDDVRQAARVLLPGVDCPPRQLVTDESLCASRQLDADTCAEKFCRDVAFRMLACGRLDLVPQALSLLGPDKVDALNDQGFSSLMFACMRGDEAMAHILINKGADVNLKVPNKCPYAQPVVRGWTALHLATVHGNLSIVQLLLENGANPEGCIQADDNYVETPLQLAASSGHADLVSLLLSKGADPYQETHFKDGAALAGKGKVNAFILAASHGHKYVLKKLLSQPMRKKHSEVMSLEEYLAEGSTSGLNGGVGGDNHDKVFDKNNKMKNKAEENNKLYDENVYTTIENDYVTIEELWEQDRLQRAAKSDLCEQQTRALQEALYHASEHGYLDIASEIRNLGVPWTVYTWTCCLKMAHTQHRKVMLQALLKDFASVRNDKAEFLDSCLTLLVDIFKNSKNEVVSHQLASVLKDLYGNEPIPAIKEIRQSPQPYIDPSYVNNAEMSDIQFLIDGNVFYAHRILLVNASNRFKAMLSGKVLESGKPCIEIPDIKYHIFEYIIQYLYHGSVRHVTIDASHLIELLGSANFFLLDGLQRHCEILLSKTINFENCTNIYKHARLYNAVELMSYCESFFLQNLPKLLKVNEVFKRVLWSAKQDVIQGLLLTLTCKLQAKQRAQLNRQFSHC